MSDCNVKYQGSLHFAVNPITKERTNSPEHYQVQFNVEGNDLVYYEKIGKDFNPSRVNITNPDDQGVCTNCLRIE